MNEMLKKKRVRTRN